MSTLLQKGSSPGNSYLHVRAGKYQNVNELRNGIKHDTVFHSSLPYLQVDKQYTIQARHAGDDSNWSVRSHFFDFPQDMIKDLQSNKMFIGIMFSGSTAMAIQTDALGVCIHQKGSQAGGRIPQTINIRVGANFIANSGCYFTNRTGLTSTAQYCKYKWGYAAGAHVELRGTVGVLNVEPKQWSYLNKESRCMIFNQGRNYGWPYAYEGPVPDKAVFYRLNMTADTSGFHYSSQAPSTGSIKLSKAGLSINGRDYLSNIQYLMFTGRGKKGERVAPYHGGQVIPANLIYKGSRIDDTMHPFALPTNIGSWNSPVYSAGSLGYIPAITANKTVEVFGNGDCFQHIWGPSKEPTPAKSMVTRCRAKYTASFFEIAKIPKIERIEFGRDLLKVNGNYTVYSPTHKPTAMLGGTQTLTMRPALLRSFKEGSTEIVEDSVSLGDMGTTAHIIYSVQSMAAGKHQVYYDHPNLSKELYYNIKGSLPELMPRIASLRDQECCPVGTVTLVGANVGSGYAIATVQYVLRRRGNQIQLVALGLNGYNDTSPGMLRVTVPQMKLSIARLFGGE